MESLVSESTVLVRLLCRPSSKEHLLCLRDSGDDGDDPKMFLPISTFNYDFINLESLFVMICGARNVD